MSFEEAYYGGAFSFTLSNMVYDAAEAFSRITTLSMDENVEFFARKVLALALIAQSFSSDRKKIEQDIEALFKMLDDPDTDATIDDIYSLSVRLFRGITRQLKPILVRVSMIETGREGED